MRYSVLPTTFQMSSSLKPCPVRKKCVGICVRATTPPVRPLSPPGSTSDYSMTQFPQLDIYLYEPSRWNRPLFIWNVSTGFVYISLSAVIWTSPMAQYRPRIVWWTHIPHEILWEPSADIIACLMRKLANFVITGRKYTFRNNHGWMGSFIQCDWQWELGVSYGQSKKRRVRIQSYRSSNANVSDVK